MTDVQSSPMTEAGGTTQTADGIFAELMTARGRADPYPTYRRLREIAPVFKSQIGAWVLTGYDDCRAVLRDARLGKDWEGFMVASGRSDWRGHVSLEYGATSLLFANPPEHTRLRGLVSKAFTPRRVDKLRSGMRETIHRLLDPLEENGGGDLLDALAFPLPVTVIGELLGVPPEVRHEFRKRIRASTATLELGVGTHELAEADAATIWMREYFAALLAEKRAHPCDDMLTAMIEAEDGGDSLSNEEIIGMGVLLFGAGFETTTNLIGNGMYALLSNPQQLKLLRDEPERMGDAIEELLRYDCSIQISGRAALEDVLFGDHLFAAGDSVLTILGAANRDPDRYRDPETLDITRQEIEPLSFGSGIHFCLGASLARAEGYEALRALLERFSTIELTETPVYRDQLGFRGLESLRIRCRR